MIPSAYRKVAFDYDYRGRRIEKRVYRRDGTTTTQWDADPLERRRFVWNGWLMVMETIEVDANTDGDVADGGDSTRIKKYTWGRDLGSQGGAGVLPASLESAGGIGGLLAVFDDNSTSADINLIYCYDANGNVGQLVEPLETTAAAGIDATYEYDVYGNVTSSGGTYATANTFRFSTKFWDDETGLGYWGYRYYDARTGRWISRDPIEESGGIGLTSYVANQPSMRVDSHGLQMLVESPPQVQTCPSGGWEIIWKGVKTYCAPIGATLLQCSTRVLPYVSLIFVNDNTGILRFDPVLWPEPEPAPQPIRTPPCPPTGPIIPDGCDALYDDMKSACGQPRSCSDKSLSCDELYQRAFNAWLCYHMRLKFQRDCIDPNDWDKNHGDQTENAIVSHLRCASLMKQKNCPGIRDFYFWPRMLD